jgi:hypothetical protein
VTYRASIAERIAWTTALRPVDKSVLQALATFADFETGKRAYPGLARMVARANLPRRTVERALQRLERDGWILATRSHRHATMYDINLERLATNYVGAKVVATDHRSVRQIGGQPPRDQSATFADLTANVADNAELLTANLADRSQVRTYPESDPKAPAASNDARRDTVPVAGATTAGGVEEAKVDATREGPADLQTNDRGDSLTAAGRPRGPGSDQAAAPGAGVPVCERADSSRPPRDQSAEPQQLTLGPHDVSARHANVRRTLAVLRDALAQRKSG